MGIEDFGILWVWGFCGDSRRFFYEYGMGMGIEIQSHGSPAARSFDLALQWTAEERGHTLKLIKKYSKGNTRHYFFTERVISRWNSLPQEAVCAPSINAFKGHLTRIRNKRMGFFKDC